MGIETGEDMSHYAKVAAEIDQATKERKNGATEYRFGDKIRFKDEMGTGEVLEGEVVAQDSGSQLRVKVREQDGREPIRPIAIENVVERVFSEQEAATDADARKAA
jgi:hypothetical protein